MKEKLLPLFNDFRVQYLKDHDRNPYAYTSYCEGYRVGYEQATSRLNEELSADIGRVKLFKEEKIGMLTAFDDVRRTLKSIQSGNYGPIERLNIISSINLIDRILEKES